MIWHVLRNTISTLFVSTKFITTLTFDTPIQTLTYGGGRDELFFSKVNENKTLVIKPLTQRVDSNMLIVTEGGIFNFFVKFDHLNPHKFIKIKNGASESRYELIKKSKLFDLYSGKTSLRLVNRSKSPISVNQKTVSKSIYLSLGTPIYINGKRVKYESL